MWRRASTVVVPPARHSGGPLREAYSLPPGVTTVPAVDRSELLDCAIFILVAAAIAFRAPNTRGRPVEVATGAEALETT